MDEQIKAYIFVAISNLLIGLALGYRLGKSLYKQIDPENIPGQDEEEG